MQDLKAGYEATKRVRQLKISCAVASEIMAPTVSFCFWSLLLFLFLDLSNGMFLFN